MTTIFKRPVTKALAFAGLTALAASQAHAGFSTVAATTAGAELGHADIFSATYGGTFAAADGLNFTNGTVTATRLNDAAGGATSRLYGASDQAWAGGNFSARAVARFASYDQTLGVFAGGWGSSFTQLFAVGGSGLDVTGSAANLNLPGSDFRFARGGGGEVYSSLAADNASLADQMVSYHLTGTNGLDRYVLFFEDLDVATGSDRDYNDLVVEVTAHPLAAVPLPPAALTGLAVLASGGLWKLRSRVRACTT